MKTSEIFTSLFFGAIGAIAGYSAIDGVEYIMAIRRNEKKETGLFRFFPGDPENGGNGDPDPDLLPHTSGDFTITELKNKGCVVVSSGFAGGFTWQCPDGSIHNTL